MTKLIRFTGDTDITSELIYEFNKRLGGKRLIVDTIHGERKLPIKFSVENEVVYDIYDYLNQDVDLYKTIIDLSEDEHLIASSFFEEKASFTKDDVYNFIDQAQVYDYLLLQSNELFDKYDFKDVDNIIVGNKDISGNNFYISDEKIRNRISPLKDIDYGKAFERYINNIEYNDSLISRIKGIFS